MENLSDTTRLLKIFKIFCLFPIRFNTKLRKYEKQPLDWVYVASLIFITTALLGTVVMLLMQWQKANDTETIHLCFKVYQQLISLLIVSSCCNIRDKLANTCNSYTEIDWILKKSNVKVNYRTFFIFLLMKHLITIAYMVAINMFCYVRSDSAAECSIYMIEHLFSYEICSLLCTTVGCLLIFSWLRFDIINSSVANIVLKGKPSNYTYNNTIVIPLNLEMTLRNITIMHFKTVKATNMVNESYGFQILLVLNVALVRIVENTHYILNGKLNAVAIRVDLFWAIMLILEAFTMFSIATCVDYKADRTAKLMNMVTCNDKIALQLEKDMFLLQSIHQRLNLEASGLQKLNNKTCLKFLATALTYVILVQGLNN